MDGLLDDLPDRRASAAEAFAVLGNETLMGVLEALATAGEPLTFSELRAEVAPDDRGNFSYHLGKLTDHFVREVEGGYALRFAGERVVRAVRAGTITADPTVPPAEIEDACAFCGAPVEMAYDEETLSARCTECDGVIGRGFPEGVFMHFEVPPAGLAGRSREETVDAAHVLYDAKTTPMMRGVCPECAGRIERSFDVCEDHAQAAGGLCPTCDTRFEVWVDLACAHCGYARKAALWFAAVTHPSAVTFLHEHGLDERIPFRKLTDDNAAFVREASATVVQRDPYRFRVDLPVDDQRLVVRMDADLTVLGTERVDPSAGG